MGRKPLNKARKTDKEKKSKWIRQLYPFFKENGLSGFNMDEVAQYLKISKATVYNHFSSKEEIIDYYLNEKRGDFDEFKNLIHHPSYSVFDRYQKSLFHLLLHMHDLSPLVRNDLKQYYPQQSKKLLRLLDNYLEQLKTLYAQGIQQGYFNPINLKLLLICDRNMLFYMSDTKYLKECGLSLRNAFDEFMTMRKNGLIRSQEIPVQTRSN